MLNFRVCQYLPIQIGLLAREDYPKIKNIKRNTSIRWNYGASRVHVINPPTVVNGPPSHGPPRKPRL